MAKYTQAQKVAAQKWDKNHMKTIGCKLKLEDAEEFQIYCNSLVDPDTGEQGRTANSVLKDYIFSCIGRTQNDLSAIPDGDEKLKSIIEGIREKAERELATKIDNAVASYNAYLRMKNAEIRDDQNSSEN